MTTPTLVNYDSDGSVATITMDDGKANVMGPPMHEQLNAALDRAEKEGAVVVLQGREGMFSGGYDMAVFQRPLEEIYGIVRDGGELVRRLLDFPRPVVAACTGHAVAQGAFLLLGADVRIGPRGSFKIGLNEVAVGLTIPHYGVELARFRLSPPWFNFATTTGRLLAPEDALAAGFLDRLVESDDVPAASAAEAALLTMVDADAHVGTKRRVRGRLLLELKEHLEAEFAQAG